MSKLYIVGHRSFKTEKSMKNYLLRMSESGRARTKIEVYNLETSMNGDFIDKEIISNSRDLQLKSLLEDSPLGELVETIKSKINLELEKKKKENKYYYTNEYNIVINKISIVNTEKELSDIVGAHGIFLFKLDKSLDWFITLLKSRNFQGLPTGYFTKRWDSSQKKYIINTDQTDIDLFNEAKKSVLETKKKKVK